jgi:hypothetical protein
MVQYLVFLYKNITIIKMDNFIILIYDIFHLKYKYNLLFNKSLNIIFDIYTNTLGG